MARLTTRVVKSPDDVVRHFDALAATYAEAHGSPERLLAYRLRLIRRLLAGAPRGAVLEIGCGTGTHLLALADEFDRAIGTDVSPAMVAAARRLAAEAKPGAHISFRVDPAERLDTVAGASVDAVVCVGTLEHIPDKERVMRQVRRVLTPGGRFVCLTPNGGYCWYRHLAPMLGRDVRHLSTDRFLTLAELEALLDTAGLHTIERCFWTFVPSGDMPAGAVSILTALDWCTRRTPWGYLRGGIAVAARPR
ncbi:MAG: class I SAM-dependent methyltransferase [Micromonosporaceae bacterium]|nr:class I SAM-dependent methyltransferase [Micromonosporaceae bacterium]